METVSPVQRLPGVVPAVLLGIGLGALLDGIVMQGLLQWHHLLSAQGHRSATSTARADAAFQAGAWLVTLAGVLLSVRHRRHGGPSPSWAAEVGLLLAGWGVFDLLDGLVDQQLLGLHHVRDDLGGPLSWDLGFLAFGAVLVLVGAQLYRLARRDEHSVVQVLPALSTIEAISSVDLPVEERG